MPSLRGLLKQEEPAVRNPLNLATSSIAFPASLGV